MGSQFQQQSLRRKIIYTVLILVLFTATLVLRQVNASFRGVKIEGIDAQARNLEIHEESLGEVELTGSALRLSLSGMRGVAVCGLWWTATQKQMKQQWNELDLIVRSLTKLQPHFIRPWLFQSWNLAYNVSVESDRIRDKYFFMYRGIELLAEGERQNRNDPDLRYNLGFYNQHKIGLSDEATTLRCLFEMSCIDPLERDPKRLRPEDASGSAVIDMDRFEQFCRKHPMLVRRLREGLKKNTPDDVVDFLADNQKIPSRFEEKKVTGAGADEHTPLKPDQQQFPILPPKDLQGRREVADPGQTDFDNFMTARDWYSYAVEPMPPPSSELGPTPSSYDPKRYRMPRSMASTIFRGYPARGQTFVAEYMEKDGWFDAEGWKITGNWFNDDKFANGGDAVLGNGTSWGTQAWTKAYQMWQSHGVSNGLYLEPEEEKDLNDRARRYRRQFNVSPGDRTVGLPVGQHDQNLRESYKAHVQLSWYDYLRTLTNFPYFYFRSQVEALPDAVEVRKTLFEAEQVRKAGDRQLAMEKYRQAFPKWRQLMEEHSSFSHDQTQQEDIYEYVLRYLDLVQEFHGKRLKELLIVQDFLMQAANRPPAPVGWLPPTYFFPQMHPNVVTALDGEDKQGQPFVSISAIATVRGRMHVPMPAPGTPPPTPVKPSMQMLPPGEPLEIKAPQKKI